MIIEIKKNLRRQFKCEENRTIKKKKLREKLGSEKYRMTRAFASWARSQQPTSRLAARLHDATDRRSPHRSSSGGSWICFCLCFFFVSRFSFREHFLLIYFPLDAVLCFKCFFLIHAARRKIYLLFSRDALLFEEPRSMFFFRVAFYYHHLLIIPEKTFLLFRGNIRRRSSHTSYDVTGRLNTIMPYYDAISPRKGNCFHGQTGI